MELDSYLSEKQKKKKRHRRYFFGIVAALGFVLLFAGLVWLFIYSPVFRVEHIVVTGNTAVTSSSVVALLQSNVNGTHTALRWLLGANNMLVWPSVLTAEELKPIPQLAAVTIGKEYFLRTITATVVERAPFGIWCFVSGGASAERDSVATAAAPQIDAGETCYSFDNRGVLFGKTYDTQGSSFFAIHDYSQTGLGLGDVVVPVEFASNLISIVEVLRSSGISVNEVILKDIGLEEINVTTYNGPTLYFSLRFLANNDLSVLQSLMAQPNFSKLQYVDFRVENRAYYK